MKIDIPILVYTQQSEDNELLGLPIDDTYSIILARIDTKYIVASYPDKDNDKTIFHVMGEIFTSALPHEEFLELTEVEEE